MSEVLLKVDGLTKLYRRRGARGRPTIAALRSVSFDLPRGVVYGLVGESGCGKTTLARCLLNLERPSSGRIIFDGIDLAGLSPKQWRSVRRRMQIVFQDPNSALNPKLNVRTSLGEGLANNGINGDERRSRIDRAADLVGIPAAHLDRRPREFSGGQKQRLVIARALVMEPEFLILDEPVSNLDVSIQAQIVNLLLDLSRELSLTYLFISHDLNLVAYLSDQVAVMYAGRIVEAGPTGTILEDPRHVYTRGLLSSAPTVVGTPGPGSPLPVAERSALAGSAAADAHREQGCPMSGTCTNAGSACLTDPPDLRDLGGGHLVACHRQTGVNR